MTYTNKEAIEGVIKGFNEVCDPVALTMGAEGSFAIVESSQFGTFHPTKDGVTVAKTIYCDSKLKQVGANFAKQASNKNLITSGDNTTTVLVVARDIVNKGNEVFENYQPNLIQSLFSLESGEVSSVEFIRGVQNAHKEAERVLRKLSKNVSKKDIRSIAKVSANNDEEIATNIVEAYNKVGLNGIIEIEKSALPRTTIKYVDGMKLDRGYKNSMFINNLEKGIVELVNPYVLLFEGNIQNLGIIEDAISKAVIDERPILIVCESINEDSLDLLFDNIQRKVLSACVIQAPEYGDKRKQLMEDFAIFTEGGVFIQGVSSEFNLGEASKIVVDSSSTSIIRAEKASKVDERVASLKVSLEDSLDREYTEQRIANLSGGVANIYVGGETPAEMDEKYDRYDDSKNAVKSAIEEGFVAGGGSTFLIISKGMKTKQKTKSEQLGYDVFVRALQAPFRQILTNGGVNANKYIKKVNVYGEGYDIKKREMVNMFDSCIIDSTKGLSSALTNAVSVSSIILNTKVVTVLE